MTPEKPKRKPTRLKHYDYSRTGVYFLTICSLNKRCLFGRIRVGGGVLDAPCVELSEYGAAIEKRLEEMARVYEHISLEYYVIMPNHIHLLVALRDGPSRTPAPTRANQTIPTFISTLKRMTNRDCGCTLWQRGYHDHVIRNDADLLRVWQYIDTNPARWAEDEYYAP